jgi:cysteine desulfurase / selenocysteine lyase
MSSEIRIASGTAPAVGAAQAALPGVAELRADFPALAVRVHDCPLAYLDNAATTQMPAAVIEAIAGFARAGRANVHRGVHALSERATAAYEGARSAVQRFVNAPEAREIVLLRGATEAINLVAHTFAQGRVSSGDEVLVTAMEHHSNIVPWQMLCERSGARLRVVPVTDEGELRLEDVERLVVGRTRLVAVTHVSNAIGTVNDVRAIADIAHARGARVLVDGAQAAAHLAIDVRALDCDFYALSGHKCYGPTGIGVLYGRAELMEEMPPFLGGGEMVHSVSFERTSYAPLPLKFEAGTPNIEGAVGLAAAIDYLSRLDRRAVAVHEERLLAYATERIGEVAGVRIIGAARRPERAGQTAPTSQMGRMEATRSRVGIVSFVVEGIHPHDVATVLDRHGVAVRAGQHCAQPLVERFGVPATLRASLALYNSTADIDALVAGLARAREIFG